MKSSFSRAVSLIVIVGLLASAVYLYVENRKLHREIEGEHSYHTPPAIECGPPCSGNISWVHLKEAVSMIKEYGNRQAKHTNDVVSAEIRNTTGKTDNPFVDSRYITFSLDTIKNFICAVETMLANKQPINANGSTIRTCDLGIKFYYIAYPGMDITKNVSQSYKGRHSLLLVPAYLDSGTGLYTEFFSSAVNASTRRPYTFAELMNYDSTNTLLQFGIPSLQLMTISESDEEVGKNHGGLCPPPDNCSSALLQLAGKN